MYQAGNFQIVVYNVNSPIKRWCTGNG